MPARARVRLPAAPTPSHTASTRPHRLVTRLETELEKTEAALADAFAKEAAASSLKDQVAELEKKKDQARPAWPHTTQSSHAGQMAVPAPALPARTQGGTGCARGTGTAY